MRAYKNNKSILPSFRSLKAEDIQGAILAARFLLVGIDISIMVKNCTLCPDGVLIYGALQIKVLVYTSVDPAQVDTGSQVLPHPCDNISKPPETVYLPTHT